MRPGMTVVPRQSTTTSALPAPVRDAAPMAAIRPFSTRIASASARGAASTPVAKAPMLTRPSVGTSPPNPRQRSRGRPTGGAGRRGRGRRDPFPTRDGGRRAPGWSPATAEQRTRAAWSSRARPRLPAAPVGLPRHARRDDSDATLVLAEATVDQIFGGVPVVGLEHSPVHDGLRRRIEHLVLELAASELGADEIPDEFHELDALTRARSGRLVVAFRVGAGIRAGERGLRGRHGLEGAARQL